MEDRITIEIPAIDPDALVENAADVVVEVTDEDGGAGGAVIVKISGERERVFEFVAYHWDESEAADVRRDFENVERAASGTFEPIPVREYRTDGGRFDVDAREPMPVREYRTDGGRFERIDVEPVASRKAESAALTDVGFRRVLLSAAESLEVLADIDEDEHVDGDQLRADAVAIRDYIERADVAYMDEIEDGVRMLTDELDAMDRDGRFDTDRATYHRLLVERADLQRVIRRHSDSD